MGNLTERLTGHTRVGLDTCVLIYHIERHPTYFPLTQALLANVEAGHLAAVASILVLMEVTVRPWQLQRSDVVQDYEEILTHFPNLTLVDVNGISPVRLRVCVLSTACDRQMRCTSRRRLSTERRRLSQMTGS